MPVRLADFARGNLLRVSQAPGLIALIGLLLLAALTSPISPDGARIFFEVGNLTDILRQVSLIGIISLGMTLVILTGGIDLSVGSVLALSTALTATALTRFWTGWSPALHMMSAIALAILSCGLLGALNGFLVGRLRVQPFIVTLASMIGVRGLAREIIVGAGHGDFVETPEAVAAILETWIRPGDLVLFKASRGVRLERALTALMASSIDTEKAAS